MPDETRDADDSGADKYKRKAMILSLTYFVGIFVFAVWQIFNYGKHDDLFEATKLNSLGDFLAGIFAPIAFIWVAVAVFIQSRELAEQRKELKLNRQEFVENRSVMKDQAKAAQAQVDAAEEQVAIAWASADANWKLSLFDKRMAIYLELKEISKLMEDERNPERDLMKRVAIVAEDAKFVFDAKVTLWIKRILNRADRMADILNRHNYLSKVVELEPAQLPNKARELDELHVQLSELYYEISEELEWSNIQGELDRFFDLPTRIEIKGYKRKRSDQHKNNGS
ncbi:hypothetical protein [Agrobacterium rosae]|uniref:hypothetical protein n=1 Tax=Agrobacterium rosae TaxID=1972867 RepID=UPI003B9EEDDD